MEKMDRKMEISYKLKYQIILSKHKIEGSAINKGMLDMDSFYFLPFLIVRILLWRISARGHLYEVGYWEKSVTESSGTFLLQVGDLVAARLFLFWCWFFVLFVWVLCGLGFFLLLLFFVCVCVFVCCCFLLRLIFRSHN